MKDLGESFSVLGVRITRDNPNGTTKIEQVNYIEEVLNRFSMNDCKVKGTIYAGC